MNQQFREETSYRGSGDTVNDYYCLYVLKSTHVAFGLRARFGMRLILCVSLCTSISISWSVPACLTLTLLLDFAATGVTAVTVSARAGASHMIRINDDALLVRLVVYLYVTVYCPCLSSSKGVA